MNGGRTALNILGLGLLLSACQSARTPSEVQPVRAARSPAPTASLAPSPDPVSPPPNTPSPTPTFPLPKPTITASPPAAKVQPPVQPDETATVAPASPEALPADPQASALNTTNPIAKTYRQPEGLFELSFPKNYSFRTIENGVSFISDDRRFGGSANVLPAEGQTLTNELLEAGLKEEYMNRLQAVEWQASTVQADGSLRVDWVGVDTNGDVLDSVSFVEQRGDHIYILNLHAINEAYAKHETDATIIVENYLIRWDE